MTEEVPVVNSAYIVILNEDGSMSTTLLQPGQPVHLDVRRASTTYDVYASSKELVSDIEGQLMADRIAKTVISQLMPPKPEDVAKARIAEALAERKSQ